MKHNARLFGIIALAAIIGFLMHFIMKKQM